MSSYVYNNNQKTGSDNCYEIASKTRASSTSYDPDTGAYDQHIDYDDTDDTIGNIWILPDDTTTEILIEIPAIMGRK
jgi:hypothetical protein